MKRRNIVRRSFRTGGRRRARATSPASALILGSGDDCSRMTGRRTVALVTRAGRTVGISQRASRAGSAIAGRGALSAGRRVSGGQRATLGGFAAIACAVLAAYLSDGTANPVVASMMASVVFFAGVGIVLQVIGSTNLPSLKVERERT